MRCCLTLLAILAVGAARAADAPKANTLTPQEIADGWILPFDGETTFGWRTAGPVTVKDGVLVLGGPMKATIRTLTEFGCCEYTVDYSSDSDVNELVKIGFPPDRFDGSSGKKVGLRIEGKKRDAVAQPLTVEVPAGARMGIRSIKIRPTDLAPIFNGKDLTGWKRFTANEKQAKSEFTVTPEGWINVKNGPGDLQTEKQWADFVFQGECISNGKALNSGVFFRCIPGQYQNGYEYQIQNGFKDNDRTKPADFGTGAIYRRVPARKVVPNDHEWFTMTLIAHGSHIATWVNGYQTVDWTDTRPENDNARNGCKLGAGPISLQGHDKTTDLSFRNLRIAELKKN
jgi:hypothetical protein